MIDYPSIDIESFHKMMMECPKVKDCIITGSTRTYLLAGTSPIAKRLVNVRVLEGSVVPYIPASGLAILLKFEKIYFKWLETHRNWKEGEYLAP